LSGGPAQKVERSRAKRELKENKLKKVVKNKIDGKKHFSGKNSFYFIARSHSYKNFFYLSAFIYWLFAYS